MNTVTASFQKDTTPKISLKLPAKAGEALSEWLEKATAFRQHILDSNSNLRALEKKRVILSAEIEKLEARADEASAAEKIPALQIQLQGVERKIEEQGAAEFIDPIRLLLVELTPLLRKAIAPLIDKEAARIAEGLLPYFRSRHRAEVGVRASDWITHLSRMFLNDWSRFNRLEGAIHCVESVLKDTLPYPYDPTQTQDDRYADAHSDYLGTSGRKL